jgi:hypothetical protein
MFWLNLAMGAFILAILLAIVHVIVSQWGNE